MKRIFLENPKIELHCHLDGALDEALARELLEEQGVFPSDEELRRSLKAPEKCENLADYLACFDLPIRLLQSEYALSEQAYRLTRRCAAENIRYVEVRFAPTSHLREGLTVRQAIEAVHQGLKRGEKEGDIRTGLILCAMRHFPPEQNLPLLKDAEEMLGSLIAGFDLAGDEASFPLSGYAEFFREAAKRGIPFTIHAGETPGSRENVRLAIELGVKRVGHGIDMRHDPELMRLCAEKRVGAELCPSSNLGTGGIGEIKELPYRVFREQGIPVSINTDNRTIGGTFLSREYALLDEVFTLTEEDMERVFRDSVEMAFAGDEVKEDLLRQWQK